MAQQLKELWAAALLPSVSPSPWPLCHTQAESQLLPEPLLDCASPSPCLGSDRATAGVRASSSCPSAASDRCAPTLPWLSGLRLAGENTGKHPSPQPHPAPHLHSRPVVPPGRAAGIQPPPTCLPPWCCPSLDGAGCCWLTRNPELCRPRPAHWPSLVC